MVQQSLNSTSVSMTVGSARVEVSPRESSSCEAIFLKIRLIILPLRVFGRAGAHCITSGAAKGPIVVRTHVMRALLSSDVS